MNIIIKNIKVLALAIVITFATGGYNLFQHQCGNTGNITTSILIEEECDSETDHNQIVCHSPEKSTHSCCESNEPENHLLNQCDDHQCCNTYLTFFKTDNYNLTKSAKKSFKFVIGYTVLLEIDLAENHLSRKEKVIFQSGIPPPDYGKQLLLSIHKLKIPSPLV